MQKVCTSHSEMLEKVKCGRLLNVCYPQRRNYDLQRGRWRCLLPGSGKRAPTTDMGALLTGS
jgi:hypothetical protein